MTVIPEHCGRCNLMGEKHETEGDCIKGLQAAIKKQNEISKQIGLVVSTRVFAVLEELVADPDCGVQYSYRDQNGEVMLLGSQVQGIMSAIFMKYQEKGDWSPLIEAQRELREEQKINVAFQDLLEECIDRFDILPDDFTERARSLLHPDRKELEEEASSEA